MRIDERLDVACHVLLVGRVIVAEPDLGLVVDIQAVVGLLAGREDDEDAGRENTRKIKRLADGTSPVSSASSRASTTTTTGSSSRSLARSAASMSSWERKPESSPTCGGSAGWSSPYRAMS